MKHIKTIYKAFIILIFISACTEDENLDFLENIAPPTNVEAIFKITQDNTGLVTVIPTAEGTVYFDVHFGDTTLEPAKLEQGTTVDHIYAEGTYEVTLIAYNSIGKTTEVLLPLVVSFQAPQNLVVTLENDAAVSKQLNITATAEFATTYEFYSGLEGGDSIGQNTVGWESSLDGLSPGTYSLKFIDNNKCEMIIVTPVTAILAPLVSVATPPNRSELDVISIFSGSYTDVAGIDYNPNWGQQTIYTAFDLNGDAMLQYSNLNYQGIDFSANVQDASAMETLHIDIWTADATSIDIFPISVTSDEFFVTKELVADQWNSFEIPVSDFTDQGLVISDIKQFKLVGSGSVFIDNLYFWKTPSAPSILTGTWKVASEAGSLKVGPSSGSGDWWSISDEQVAERACFYNDEFLFGADGSFKNVLGSDTWLEVWQGSAADMCGSPIAPYDGSITGTFIHDDTNNKVTVNGSGAYLGIPKANNAGELPNVAVPSSITYDITLSNNNTEMEVIIEAGSGVFWTYKLVKDTALTISPIDGTWKIAPEAGSLKVGPSSGNGDWWSISDEQVAERACFYDDEYVFNADGTFSNVLGSETWVEVFKVQ